VTQNLYTNVYRLFKNSFNLYFAGTVGTVDFPVCDSCRCFRTKCSECLDLMQRIEEKYIIMNFTNSTVHW